jgi:hypothetical protein
MILGSEYSGLLEPFRVQVKTPRRLPSALLVISCASFFLRKFTGLSKRPRRKQQGPSQHRGPQSKQGHQFSKATELNELDTECLISVYFRLARITIVILIIYIVIFYMSSNYR